ncbi:hypothetical protein SAMN05192561_101404 [Halopenitus malekzadehii]|uniref:Uncharacterized protein n=1 Tax=Halopenitus malekzadehii TaxID=1267564 RepID=A0A1H6HX10_9EURY|nr:hypothetical protein [Halopenitus malekzadehii]SEH38678.1 hypothetical protein SAMN05192561_101404 [Halopenitus malekzadehii]
MTDDGAAFDPDDLDFTRDERVTEIDDGRYVVSAGDGPPRVPPDEDSLTDLLNEVTDAEGAVAEVAADAAADAATADAAADAATADAAADAAASESSSTAAGPDAGDAGERNSGTRPRDAVTSQDVSRWLATSFAEDGFAYGFDATLSVDDEVVRHRMVSNDVTAAFETLLTWFTRHAASEAPPDEALGILVAAAELPVQYPPGTLERYLDRHDLSPEDSIGELLRVAEAHGGLRIDTGDGSATAADVTDEDVDADTNAGADATAGHDERAAGQDTAGDGDRSRGDRSRNGPARAGDRVDDRTHGVDEASTRSADGSTGSDDRVPGFDGTPGTSSRTGEAESGTSPSADPDADPHTDPTADRQTDTDAESKVTPDDGTDDNGTEDGGSWNWVGSDVDTAE